MPGSRPCEIGCTCWKHPQGFDPEVTRARRREDVRRYAAANRDRLLEAKRSYYAERPKHNMRSKYGLSLAQWQAMIEAQEGACYLCGEPLCLDNPQKVHVDHDHSCCRGKRSCGTCVRGIACHGCNTGVGLFGDGHTGRPREMFGEATVHRTTYRAVSRQWRPGKRGMKPWQVRKASAGSLMWSQLRLALRCR